MLQNGAAIPLGITRSNRLSIGASANFNEADRSTKDASYRPWTEARPIQQKDVILGRCWGASSTTRLRYTKPFSWRIRMRWINQSTVIRTIITTDMARMISHPLRNRSQIAIPLSWTVATLGPAEKLFRNTAHLAAFRREVFKTCAD